MPLETLKIKPRQSTVFLGLCVPLALVLSGGCALGQSGNEGDLPGAPCPHGGSLFEAEIVSLDGACVTVQVKAILQQGDPLVDENATPLLDEIQLGEQLTAKLGTTYAYNHGGFSSGDAVVVLPGLWGDMLEFQLLPLSSNGVEIWWGPRLIYASTGDLVAPDCTNRLQQQPEQDRLKSEASTSTPTAPPQEPPDCSAAASP